MPILDLEETNKQLNEKLQLAQTSGKNKKNQYSNELDEIKNDLERMRKREEERDERDKEERAELKKELRLLKSQQKIDGTISDAINKKILIDMLRKKYVDDTKSKKEPNSVQIDEMMMNYFALTEQDVEEMIKTINDHNEFAHKPSEKNIAVAVMRSDNKLLWSKLFHVVYGKDAEDCVLSVLSA